MIRSITLALIATAAFAADGDAKPVAAGAAPSVADLVKKADTNKDGAISKEELAAVKDEKEKATLTALDKNKDGALDKAEIEAGEKPVTEKK